MALFGGKPKNAEPDEFLPALDVDGAARLTTLAADYLRRRGHEITAAGNGVISLADGKHYGLYNLSMLAAQNAERDWPAIVEDHFSQMIQAEADQVRYQEDPANWYFKLRPIEDISERPEYAREVLPGILALAAIDTPTHVSESVKDGEPYLADLAAYTERAMTNLAQLPAPEHIRLVADENVPDSAVHLFAADDFFGASRVLILEQLLASQLGLDAPEHGCIIAVPHRCLLVVHPVRTARALIAATRLMVDVASGEYDSEPGPVSRQLYYRTADGDVEQITSFGDDGGVSINGSGRLSMALALE